MTGRTRLTRNVREGETLSFDGGRITLTLVKRYGRSARLLLDMPAEVRIDRPAPIEEPADTAPAPL